MEAKSRQPLLSLLPVPRTDVDPDLVLEVVEQVAATLPPSLRLLIDGGSEPDPVITIAEHERRTTARLSRLTARFSRRGVVSRRAEVTHAVHEWLDARPVSDTTAAMRGIATIGWNDQLDRPCWSVVVPRPNGAAVTWVPTTKAAGPVVRQVRTEALDRAKQLTVTPVISGEVTVWLYLLNPALSTAVLSQPGLLAGNGSMEDLYAVFSPLSPVAVASETAARRLTEESSEPHQMLPLTALDSIGWM